MLASAALLWQWKNSGETAASASGAPSYDAAGVYRFGPRNFTINPPKTIVGTDGLPLSRYDVGYRRNPVDVAQYGLWAHRTYLAQRDPALRRIMVHVADWLVDAQQRDGRWLYHFDHSLSGLTVPQPWASALAQGQAMSLLTRAYRLTSDRRYLAAAVNGLRPLRRNVRDDGLLQCFGGDCRLPFYEEYPTDPPSYILNGFLFALIGLWDLASVAPRSDALQLHRAGRRTAIEILPRYDLNGEAAYDLVHETIGGAPNLSHRYQLIVARLLRALDSIERSPILSEFAQRWGTSGS